MTSPKGRVFESSGGALRLEGDEGGGEFNLNLNLGSFQDDGGQSDHDETVEEENETKDIVDENVAPAANGQEMNCPAADNSSPPAVDRGATAVPSVTTSQKKRRKRRIRVIPSGLRPKKRSPQKDTAQKSEEKDPQSSPPPKVKTKPMAPPKAKAKPRAPPPPTFGFSMLECLPAPTVQESFPKTKKTPNKNSSAKKTPAKTIPKKATASKAVAKPTKKTAKTPAKTPKKAVKKAPTKAKTPAKKASVQKATAKKKVPAKENAKKAPRSKTPAKRAPAKKTSTKTPAKTPRNKAPPAEKTTTTPAAKTPKKPSVKAPPKAKAPNTPAPKKSQQTSEEVANTPQPSIAKNRVQIPSPPEAVAKAPPTSKKRVRIPPPPEAIAKAPPKKKRRHNNNTTAAGSEPKTKPRGKVPQQPVDDNDNNTTSAVPKAKATPKSKLRGKVQAPLQEVDDMSWNSEDKKPGNRLKIVKMKPASNNNKKQSSKGKKKGTRKSKRKAVIGRGRGTDIAKPDYIRLKNDNSKAEEKEEELSKRGANKNVDDAMVHWLRNRSSKKKQKPTCNKADDAMLRWLRKRNQERKNGFGKENGFGRDDSSIEKSTQEEGNATDTEAKVSALPNTQGVQNGVGKDGANSNNIVQSAEDQGATATAMESTPTRSPEVTATHGTGKAGANSANKEHSLEAEGTAEMEAIESSPPSSQGATAIQLEMFPDNRKATPKQNPRRVSLEKLETGFTQPEEKSPIGLKGASDSHPAKSVDANPNANPRRVSLGTPGTGSIQPDEKSPMGRPSAPHPAKFVTPKPEQNPQSVSVEQPETESARSEEKSPIGSKDTSFVADVHPLNTAEAQPAQNSRRVSLENPETKPTEVAPEESHKEPRDSSVALSSDPESTEVATEESPIDSSAASNADPPNEPIPRSVRCRRTKRLWVRRPRYFLKRRQLEVEEQRGRRSSKQQQPQQDYDDDDDDDYFPQEESDRDEEAGIPTWHDDAAEQSGKYDSEEESVVSVFIGSNEDRDEDDRGTHMEPSRADARQLSHGVDELSNSNRKSLRGSADEKKNIPIAEETVGPLSNLDQDGEEPDKAKTKRKQRSDKGKKRGPRNPTASQVGLTDARGELEPLWVSPCAKKGGNASKQTNGRPCSDLRTKRGPREPLNQADEQGLAAASMNEDDGTTTFSAVVGNQHGLQCPQEAIGMLDEPPSDKPKRKTRKDKGVKRNSRKKATGGDGQSSLGSNDMPKAGHNQVHAEKAVESRSTRGRSSGLVQTSGQQNDMLVVDALDVADELGSARLKGRKRGPYRMNKLEHTPRADADKGVKRGAKAEIAARSANKTGTPRRIVGYYSSHRCGSCIGCRAVKNCGKCKPCMDMPEFGGAGKILRLCILKRCLKRKPSQSAVKGKATKPTKKPKLPPKTYIEANSDLESLSCDDDSVANNMSDMEWDDEQLHGEVLARLRRASIKPNEAIAPPGANDTCSGVAASGPSSMDGAGHGFGGFNNDDDGDREEEAAIAWDSDGSNLNSQSAAEFARSLQDRQRAEVLDMQDEEDEEENDNFFCDHLPPPPPIDMDDY